MSLIQVDIVTQKLGADAIYTKASKGKVKNVLVGQHFPLNSTVAAMFSFLGFL